MASPGNLMRRALRRHLLPELRRLGFIGSSNTFQRLLPEAQDLLALQYWKYGGEFILEFARRERGVFETAWGEIVAEPEMDVAYVSPLQRARLEQRGPSAGPELQGFDYS